MEKIENEQEKSALNILNSARQKMNSRKIQKIRLWRRQNVHSEFRTFTRGSGL